MARTIAEQVQRCLQEREEERCLLKESEFNQSEETRGKKVKRREIPLPTVRLGPKALCQDTEFLLMVEELDYDLSDESFQKYCSGRGVLYVAGELGSELWRFHEQHSLSRDEYFESENFRFADEVNGSEYEYTDAERVIGWEILRLNRAKLQDSWELYLQEQQSLRQRVT
jgi:hypothetical protein